MTKNIFYILLIIAFCGCATKGNDNAAASADSWPIFRASSDLSGYTKEKICDKPTLLWSYKSDQRSVSSPVVLRGTTYWCDTKGVVRGVDAEGNEAFTYDLQRPIEATPMLHDSTLYIGCIDGSLAAISLPKRDTTWCFRCEGQVSASPNSVKIGERTAIIFGSYDNYMYCIDQEQGNLINRFESGYYINGAVAVKDNYAVFGGCDGWLRLIDCKQGVMCDSLRLEGYIPSSPAIANDKVYIGDYAGNIYEVQLSDGRFADHRTVVSASEENASLVSVPAVSPTTLYVISNDKYLSAINRKDGSTTWRYLLKGNVGESSPVICRDKIIVCTKTGIVTILNANNGELLWEYDTGEQIVSSPAVVRNRFYILTAKGTLFCFGENKK